MSISMLAAILARQDELYKKPANIADMMKWSDNPAVREWGLRLENALLREKKEAVTNCNQFKVREVLEKIDRIVWDKSRHTKEEVEAHRLATEALTSPPKNCDRQYQNAYDVLRLFTAETGRQIFETVDVIDWLLFAEAKEDAKYGCDRQNQE